MGPRHGSWLSINGGLGPGDNNGTISLPVFLLSAPHGLLRAPIDPPSRSRRGSSGSGSGSGGGLVSFGYAVLPGVGRADDAAVGGRYVAVCFD